MKKEKKSETKTENKSIKRLYRSRHDKVIAGVCGGIAEYFNIDPVWVRLVFVLLFFADGTGLLIYIVLWILMPQNPTQAETKNTAAETAAEKLTDKVSDKMEEIKKKEKTGRETEVLGIIVVMIGLALLMKNIFSWFNFNFVWPAAIILVGVYLITRR